MILQLAVQLRLALECNYAFNCTTVCGKLNITLKSLTSTHTLWLCLCV